jgi:hypothetical protein
LSPVFLGDAVEQVMLDLIPFRGAWWIVSDLDGEAGVVGELLQFHFPEPHTRTV